MQFVRSEIMANVLLSGDDLTILVFALSDYSSKIEESLKNREENVNGVYSDYAISKRLENRFQEFLETGGMK